MRTRVVLLGAAVAFGSVVSLDAQQASPGGGAPRHLLMVVSKQQPGMALYDADTHELHCKSGNLGVAPHEGEFSPDGRMAYVPTYGSSAVGAPGTDEHEIHFIRTSDCQTVHTLDTGDYKRPHHVRVGESGTVYVTAELKESILVIDPQTREITATLPTGSTTTHMFALTRDESRIVTSNVMGQTISIIDVPGRRLLQTIPTEVSNQRMALSPDEKWFVTSLGQQRRVAFYTLADGNLDFTVDVDGSPFVSQFSTDGRYLYVMGSMPGGRGRRGGQPGGGGSAPQAAAPQAPVPPAGGVGGNLRAWKIDVEARRVVASITENLGSGAGGLVVHPANGRVYISAMAHDLVSVIDPDTWTVVETIAAEDNPDGMAIVEVR
jgi:YVTN family beta-propeller protein